MVLRSTSTVSGKKYGTIREEEEEEGARSNLSTKHGTLDDEVKRELASGSYGILRKLEPIQPALR